MDLFCNVFHDAKRMGPVFAPKQICEMNPESVPTPLEQLPGVTPGRLDLLARLGLATVGDLLFHFPRGYEDLTDLRPIADLAGGKRTVGMRQDGADGIGQPDRRGIGRWRFLTH